MHFYGLSHKNIQIGEPCLGGGVVTFSLGPQANAWLRPCKRGDRTPGYYRSGFIDRFTASAKNKRQRRRRRQKSSFISQSFPSLQKHRRRAEEAVSSIAATTLSWIIYTSQVTCDRRHISHVYEYYYAYHYVYETI